jgi:ribonuclease P protein component
VTSAESLPRARIIRRGAVFDATRLKGRRVSNRWMALNFIGRDAIPPGETGSVGFLTPKRVGAANKRTQLRRRMRDIYLVWIARPPALELPFDELKKCMTALRERVRP